MSVYHINLPLKAKIIKYLQSFIYIACVNPCINTYLSNHAQSHNPANDFIFLTIFFLHTTHLVVIKTFF